MAKRALAAKPAAHRSTGRQSEISLGGNTGSGPPAILGFFGGNYNIEVLRRPTVLYRGGRAGKPFGDWFSQTPPESVAHVRMNSAVKAQWINARTGGWLGSSPLDTRYGIEFPAGTKLYKGPVSYQGGVHVGGPDEIQIFIPNADQITGTRVVSIEPLL